MKTATKTEVTFDAIETAYEMHLADQTGASFAYAILLPDVAAIIAQRKERRHDLVTAKSAFEETANNAERNGDWTERRAASLALPAARAKFQQAQVDLELIQRQVAPVLESAFARVEGPISAEHEARKRRLEAALRDVLHLAEELVAVECVSDAFALPGGSLGGGRGAVPFKTGQHVRNQINYWQETIFKRS